MLLRIRQALRRRRRKRFSVITPTLNPGPKLEATINSVLSQNEELFEYIIVDGGSTDETLNVIRKYGKRIKCVSKKDRGVYDAMNKGIKMARGDYLYFLGAGDHLRENILEKVEKELPDEPLTFVYGNVYVVNIKSEYLGEFDDDKLAKLNICHQAIFYERTIFEVIGKYDLRYRLLADYAFNLKCFADQRIRRLYVDEVIADFEGGGISTGTDMNFIKDFAPNNEA
jgi:glycosyltransferase involved in cell wall biosynthesis